MADLPHFNLRFYRDGKGLVKADRSIIGQGDKVHDTVDWTENDFLEYSAAWVKDPTRYKFRDQEIAEIKAIRGELGHD